MSQPDNDFPLSWSTPVVHDWPEHARLSEPDGDTVRVIQGPASYPLPGEHRQPEPEDDGARLDTYEARRRRTVDEVTEDLDAAIHNAKRATVGLATIGYHTEVVAQLEDMIASGNQARELLNIFEGRQ